MTFPVALAAVTVLFLLGNRFGGGLVTLAAGGAGGISQRTKDIISYSVAILLLVAGVCVILSKAYGESENKWAYSVVGSAVAFLLKP
jgi:hypothetical protein